MRSADGYDLTLSPMETVPSGLFSMAHAAPETEMRESNRMLAERIAEEAEERRLLRSDRRESIYQSAQSFRDWEVQEGETLLHLELEHLVFAVPEDEVFPSPEIPGDDQGGILTGIPPELFDSVSELAMMRAH
jgi:hypothetical protein